MDFSFVFLCEMNIEKLYKDKQFNQFLTTTANKNLLQFDDFKQEVFLEMIDSNCQSSDDCKRATWRVRSRMKTYEMKNKSYSIDLDRDSFSHNANSVLWEDNNRVW